MASYLPLMILEYLIFKLSLEHDNDNNKNCNHIIAVVLPTVSILNFLICNLILLFPLIFRAVLSTQLTVCVTQFEISTEKNYICPTMYWESMSAEPEFLDPSVRLKVIKIYLNIKKFTNGFFLPLIFYFFAFFGLLFLQFYNKIGISFSCYSLN